MWFLQDCLMPTQWLSRSEAFTVMIALRGSSIIDAIPKLSEELDSTIREQARNDFPGTYSPEI
jgi:hypothetical protein